MKETFPRKKAGSPLSARHINDLSDVARRVGNLKVGPRLFARHSRSQLALSSEPERHVGIFEIYNTKIDASDTVDSGLYLGRVRWWSPSGDKWETDDSGRDWELDGSDLGLNNLRAGDKLIAYWDYQRGMLVPMSTNQGMAGIIKFKVNEAAGVEYTDATFAVDSITILSPIGASEYPGGSEPLFVNNLLGFPAANDADGIAIYNPGSGLWEGIPAPWLTECPEETSEISASS